MTPEDREALRGVQWITASGGQGDCLEVAKLSTGRIAIRDTEAPDQDPFVVRPEVWATFKKGMLDGVFPF